MQIDATPSSTPSTLSLNVGRNLSTDTSWKKEKMAGLEHIAKRTAEIESRLLIFEREKIAFEGEKKRQEESFADQRHDIERRRTIIENFTKQTNEQQALFLQEKKEFKETVQQFIVEKKEFEKEVQRCKESANNELETRSQALQAKSQLLHEQEQQLQQQRSEFSKQKDEIFRADQDASVRLERLQNDQNQLEQHIKQERERIIGLQLLQSEKQNELTVEWENARKEFELLKEQKQQLEKNKDLLDIRVKEEDDRMAKIQASLIDQEQRLKKDQSLLDSRVKEEHERIAGKEASLQNQQEQIEQEKKRVSFDSEKNREAARRLQDEKDKLEQETITLNPRTGKKVAKKRKGEDKNDQKEEEKKGKAL